MKVSYNWLKEHLPLELSATELSAHLLKIGFEVAGHERLGPTFTGVVVGKIVSKEKHPNADKLSVCVVDDGATKRTVVCGAPNVDAGQTVAYARPGAVLPGNFKIEGRKLRGVESQGMICSRAELGLPKDVDGIWVMGEGPALGADVGSLLGPADDILEVEVTTNRPDCLSHRGLARELAAYFRKELKPLGGGMMESAKASFPVTVEDREACPFYGGRLIEDVTVGESPAWLKAKIVSIGLRPINSVVEITNYVLHDIGQPLHAFDADKLNGSRIIVRRSKTGEKLLALDHRVYDLPAGLLVIADAEKPVALAGVMGGEDSAVTTATKRIILEGAFFNPAEARKSSQKTRLRSDSSYRFERGTDPEAPRAAADRAAGLILQIAGGSAAKPSEATAPRPARRAIQASVGKINAVLGADFADLGVKQALGAIGDVNDDGNGVEFTYTAPSWRHDLRTVNDLSEEVGRFLGYENIPYRMAPMAPRAARLTPVETESRRARMQLAALGLWEAYNYDLVSEKTFLACRLSAEGQPRVAQPLSEDWALMRSSLLPGLLKNAQYNLSRGADSVRFFEVGKSYAIRGKEVDETWRVAGILLGPVLDARWQGARTPRASFYDGKAIVEDLLEKAGPIAWAKLSEPGAGKTPSDPLFHPSNSLRATINGTPVATVGWLHPRVARAHDLEREGAIVFDANLDWLAGRESAPPRFGDFSALPSSRRDLALLLDKATPFARLEGVIRDCLVPELQSVLLFDVYEGKNIPEDKKSLAIRLTFGRFDRTLTDAEVGAAVEKIVAALAKELGASLRG
ncbi:MAG: phenylalanine--tRNA ligase subunit beta [Elusimicrobiota bacterium]|nr:phenylalanine--tRNA ligase subunit beta [Elusimicrobiota bacterium]